MIHKTPIGAKAASYPIHSETNDLKRTFMPALPKNVDLDPDGVSVWRCYLLPAEEFALKKEANIARTEDSDDVVGVRVLGGFLLDF